MSVHIHDCEYRFDTNLILRGQVSDQDGRVSVGSVRVLYRGKVDVTQTFRKLELDEFEDEIAESYKRECEQPRCREYLPTGEVG